VTVIAAQQRTLHCNIAPVDADLAPGQAPPMADATSATAVAWTGQTQSILAQHLFHGTDTDHRTEAIKRDVHILPNCFQAGLRRYQ
jgi:hypothetical protein